MGALTMLALTFELDPKTLALVNVLPPVLIFFGTLLIFMELRSLRADVIRLLERLAGKM